MNFYRNLSLTKVVLFDALRFLSLRNLASPPPPPPPPPTPYYMPCTSKEILDLQKLYSCCGVIFRDFDYNFRFASFRVVLLILSFSKKFLADLKMSSGFLEFFVFIWFCIFCLPNILQKHLEDFSHSISHLVVAQIFPLFDCLHSPWCNFSGNFLMNS